MPLPLMPVTGFGRKRRGHVHASRRPGGTAACRAGTGRRRSAPRCSEKFISNCDGATSGWSFSFGEAHRALRLGRGVDEAAQRVARQRVVVAAGRDELELARLVVVALGVAALEQEALDLVGRVARPCRPSCRARRGTASAGRACPPSYGVPSRSSTSPKTSTLPGAEDVGRQPVEGRPVDRRGAGPTPACCEKPRIELPSKVRLSATSAGTSCRSRACAADPRGR